MSSHVISTLPTRSIRVLLVVAAGTALMAGSVAFAAPTADTRAAGQQVAAADATAEGSWEAHRYVFHYLGTNTTYGCRGLADKLGLLLRTIGARDVQAMPVCLGHTGPYPFAQTDVKFESLMPPTASASAASGSGASAAGVWRHVTWTPRTPMTLGHGDCALVEQVLSTVLPMFATRNLHQRIDCAEHDDYGSFSVSFDVFVPADSRPE